MSALSDARAALARANPHEGERLALLALAAARRDGDVETEARALSVSCRAACDAGAPVRGIRFARVAVANAEQGRTPAELVAVAFADLHAALVEHGAESSARHFYDRGVHLARGGAAERWRLAADRGFAMLQLGDARGAAGILETVRGSLVDGIPTVRAHRALALLACGERLRAEAEAEVLATAPREAWESLCLARVWLGLGASRLAKAEADRAARAARLCGRPDWKRQAAVIVRAAERQD